VTRPRTDRDPAADRDVELLAGALDAGFTGQVPLENALAAYERQRNEETQEIYEFGHQMAALEPPAPELQQLLGALRGNQEDTDRFLGLIAGSTRPSAFFAPKNVGRIMHQAALTI
jgi:2-polyprenyl-6-methoxyphenol hydroxylase-like FAD-dependent oxidoreductase